MKHYQKNNGFTLIELLVVVLIIGILAAVALPQYQTAVDKSRYSTIMAAVRAMKDGQELYHMANGEYTLSLEDLPLPAQCVIVGAVASCRNFTLNLDNQSYIYGVTLSNAYLMWLDHSSRPHRIDCYAYKKGGERAKRLCLSLGGKTSQTDWKEDCGCIVYNLQ